MGRVVVVENLTLDGVMQAPGAPDEDRRGGFAYGGWAVPYSDEVMMRVMGEGMTGEGALLFGRRTYENFYGYWPHQTDNPFTEVLNTRQKYVASRTLQEPLPWINSTLLAGEATDTVAELQERVAEDLTVLGSGELVRSLVPSGLVDEYVLLVFPLILGTGTRLFPGLAAPRPLQLLDSVVTTTGVVIARYQPADRA